MVKKGVPFRNTPFPVKEYPRFNRMMGHVPVLDSREVAEMVGKTHAHLCRDIDLYAKVISENPKLDSQNFFIERTYKTDGNQSIFGLVILHS